MSNVRVEVKAVNEKEVIDELTSDIYDAIEEALKAMGEEVQGRVQELISVPVEYILSSYLRSVPGEPPRLDTGELYNNVTFKVTSDGPGRYTLEVASARPSTPSVPSILEDVMDRPYMATVWDWLEPNAEKVFFSKLSPDL